MAHITKSHILSTISNSIVIGGYYSITRYVGLCPGLGALAWGVPSGDPGLGALACEPWPGGPGLGAVALGPWPGGPGLEDWGVEMDGRMDIQTDRHRPSRAIAQKAY